MASISQWQTIASVPGDGIFEYRTDISGNVRLTQATIRFQKKGQHLDDTPPMYRFWFEGMRMENGKAKEHTGGTVYLPSDARWYPEYSEGTKIGMGFRSNADRLHRISIKVTHYIQAEELLEAIGTASACLELLRDEARKEKERARKAGV